jgi:hypothetical protein
MNVQCKELVAKRTAAAIKHTLKVSKGTPTSMDWKYQSKENQGLGEAEIAVEERSNRKPESVSVDNNSRREEGRDSSVGIATRYGLDGPGIESRWRRDFPRPFRPILAPTQPPIQWVLGFSRG